MSRLPDTEVPGFFLAWAAAGVLLGVSLLGGVVYGAVRLVGFFAG